MNRRGDINWSWKKKNMKNRMEEERNLELGRATGLVDRTDEKEIVIYTCRQHGQ